MAETIRVVVERGALVRGGDLVTWRRRRWWQRLPRVRRLRETDPLSLAPVGYVVGVLHGRAEVVRWW